MPADADVATSLAPTASAFDGNSTVQVTMSNGDIYFHRYNHDNYGESNSDCSGLPSQRSQSLRTAVAGPFRRARRVRACERPLGQRLPAVDGRRDQRWLLCAGADLGPLEHLLFRARTSRRAAPSPLNWAEGQYLRLSQSIDAGYNLDTPSVVKAKYRGAGPILGNGGKCVDDAGASTNNGTAIQIWTCNATSAQSWTWNSGDGTLRVFGKCMDVTGGGTANGTQIQLWDCNGTGAQEWRWRQQSRLMNPQSGRCLDVTGGGTADGTRLQLWDCNDTAAQAWHLP